MHCLNSLSGPYIKKNETVSRQNLWAGNIAKSMVSRETVNFVSRESPPRETLKVMLHEMIRKVDFERNTA